MIEYVTTVFWNIVGVTALLGVFVIEASLLDGICGMVDWVRDTWAR